MLKAELDLDEQPLLKELGCAQASQDLRMQLLNYATCSYPFNTTPSPSEPSIAYWKRYENHKDARVLAVRNSILF